MSVMCSTTVVLVVLIVFCKQYVLQYPTDVLMYGCTNQPSSSCFSFATASDIESAADESGSDSSTAPWCSRKVESLSCAGRMTYCKCN